MADRAAKSFVAGAGVGLLGGLIGLGGAEFRLPLLIGIFGFGPLAAVILNKAMSLVVVTFAMPFRTGAVSFAEVIVHWPVILNLLGGSLIGAWSGATWAVKLKTAHFYQVICILLLIMAVALLIGHQAGGAGNRALDGIALVIAGLAAGFAIGVVASLLGVAGGELLIPTLVLLYGLDVKLAGSLSLAISLPTMLAGFARYSRDDSIRVLREQSGFVLTMAAGSILGVFAGGQLLKIVDARLLLPLLAAILVASALKMWTHPRA